MPDTLQDICADKRQHVAAQKEKRSEQELLGAVQQCDPPRGFRNALLAKEEAGQVGLIAEIKKASPSKGIIRQDFDVPALAAAYQQGGAACISVLTDEPYFRGNDAYIAQAREVVALPILRKDFMLDPYQIIESRALGADCVLLIMAALSDAQAGELNAAAEQFGMDVLVEVHDLDELGRAIKLDPALLGINNRDLRTLRVDLQTTELLAIHAPDSAMLVCESGISGPQDIARMRIAGVQHFLVGESLMREEDVALATRALLSGAG